MTKRVFYFLFGAVSYDVFFASFLYAIGFVGNFLVPKTMDSSSADHWPTALLIDLGLLALFAVQHSVMARPSFKRVFTKIVPATLERSIYVLASSVALLYLFWQWRPLGGMVWDVQNPFGRTVLYGGFAFGWLLILYVSFLINHFDLFGLQQVWLNLKGRPQPKARFVTPFLYRMVRHPLYVGWSMAFWCTPTMTVTHLVFALGTTAYILIAIQLEERNLIEAHPEYAEYREQVPMLVPGLPRSVETPRAAALRRG
ncbi:MAG: methanethiol S-methyltransferase [Terracidiphilus sp.]